MSKQSDQSDPNSIYQQSKTTSPKSLDDQLRAAAKVQAGINAENHAESKKRKSPWVPAMAFACVSLVGINLALKVNNDTDTLIESSSLLADTLPAPALASQPSLAPLERDTLPNITSASKRTEAFSIEAPVSISALADSTVEELEINSFSSSDVQSTLDITAEVSSPASISNQERTVSKSGLELETPVLTESDLVDTMSVKQELAEPKLLNITDHIPNLVLDIRYFGTNNFIGERVDGYLSVKALLTEDATTALAKVQQQANDMGLGLKIFDAYRPQRSVDHFLLWVTQPDDAEAKATYYPNINKTELFELGYLVERSSHSRGSTVDLTLINLSDGSELDMGTDFDFFDAASWLGSKEISETAQSNRKLLGQLMASQGFEPFEAEWWHFTLKDEPYVDQYFDVPVE